MIFLAINFYLVTKNPYILALKIWNFLDIFAQSEYGKDHPTLIIIEEINKKNGINPLKAWWGIDVSIYLWNKATYYLFIFLNTTYGACKKDKSVTTVNQHLFVTTSFCDLHEIY